MLPDDVYRSRLAATIASLRYWVPSISDTAYTDETETGDYWRLAVAPHVAPACPFELILRSDQHYDLLIAGEAYENRPVNSLDLYLPLAKAITAGEVLQRRWMSAATGLPLAVETLVTLPDGTLWRDGQTPATGVEGGAVSQDRHFLPYRR